MNNEADNFWQKVARGLARRSGCAPLTPEEAQKEFDSLPDTKLSEAEIDAIVDQATSGELAVWTPTPPDDDTTDFDREAIEEDVLQLNRNEGQSDEETDKLLDELRRKALEDGQADGQEDSTGVDGDQESPEQGG
ncbi:MAG: hypothetical protein Kow0010_26650 [Dehalococcoidia bacterium]